jgi:hypothetical protein
MSAWAGYTGWFFPGMDDPKPTKTLHGAMVCLRPTEEDEKIGKTPTLESAIITASKKSTPSKAVLGYREPTTASANLHG